MGRPIARLPVAVAQSQDYLYTAYPFVRYNLLEWLLVRPDRTPSQVSSLARGLFAMLRCLSATKVVYTDLKPSNLLVQEDEVGNPQVSIGDLGGFYLPGDTHADLPRCLVPPALLRCITPQTLEDIVSLLLGQVFLQLLLENPRRSTSSPYLVYLSCLAQSGAECATPLVKELVSNLAPGLSARVPSVRRLIVATLALLGGDGQPPLRWREVADSYARDVE
jgi:serine/threonine protein kinase